MPNDDTCSWYEFTCDILKGFDIEISQGTSEEYPQKAYRPRHYIINLSRAKETGFVIPTWREALKNFLDVIG